MPKKVEESKILKKRNEIKKLKQEGKYERIYLDYGKDEYKKILDIAKIKDMEYELGKNHIKIKIEKVKQILNKIRKKVSILFGSLAGVGFLCAGSVDITMMQDKINNGIKYKSEINDYNQRMEEYTKKLKEKNVTDLQLFIKLIKDIKENTKYDKKVERDINGYRRLESSVKGRKAVCRHHSDHLQYLLNKINPKYNARTFIVNIKRIDRETNEVLENEKGFLGMNHAVVAVDIKEKNITLILDPTNAKIGVWENNKIKIFNDNEKEDYKESDLVNTKKLNIFDNGILDSICIECPTEFFKSLFNSNISFEELEKEYGIKAQKKAYMEINEIYDENITKKAYKNYEQENAYIKSLRVSENELNKKEEKIENKKQKEEYISYEEK